MAADPKTIIGVYKNSTRPGKKLSQRKTEKTQQQFKDIENHFVLRNWSKLPLIS